MMTGEELSDNVQECKKPRNSSELICRPDVSNPLRQIVVRDFVKVKPICDVASDFVACGEALSACVGRTSLVNVCSTDCLRFPIVPASELMRQRGS